MQAAMDCEGWLETSVAAVTERLQTCNRCRLRRRSGRGEYCLPSRDAVRELLDDLIGVLFPGCHGRGPVHDGRLDSRLCEQLKKAARRLMDQVRTSFEYECERARCDPSSCECNCDSRAGEAVRHLIHSLPGIQDMLQEDIDAAYEGDPAAKSPMEVVMSYPAIQAIATYRIAHALYETSVPLIPRIMTEFAHSRTGIDIHPGAAIGRRFFIDHGTGVVIGETTVIGNNVKIYQGVTLGALSFPKDASGNPVKGLKRHPEVRDNVTIYAEATILGGDTVIGEGSEIGGNVWLTHSVPARSRVHNAQPAPRIS
jgi:serine O-acetyltransferase